MGIRDEGFGLNYNQGFASGGPNMSGAQAAFGMMGQAQGSAWDQLGQKKQMDFTGAQNAANRGLELYGMNQGNALQRYGIDTSAQTARQGNELSYKASILPNMQKQARFNAVFPLFQNALGGFGQGLSGIQGGYQGKGAFGTEPNIDASPVLSPNQVQQQVNAARSGNDAAAAGQQHHMAAQLAGRGFGANSPLAMALGQNIQGQNMATNTANERDTRLGAATANAQHVLTAQQAQEQQYANRQQEEIERGKTYVGGLGTMLGSFGSLIG